MSNRARLSGGLTRSLGALLFILPLSQLVAEAPPWADSARAGHAVLTRLCDDFGGRLTGSVANEGALTQLAAELRALGLQPERVPFSMPGWARGADQVELLAPLSRPLRVAALGYTSAHAPFEAEVVAIGAGGVADYPTDVTGKIALLDPACALTAREFSQLAFQRGARGILFINREGGGQLLARTGSFIGEPLVLPVYSLAQEEGRWLQRLLQRGQTVRVRMATQSQCRVVTTANLVVRIPGRSPARLIVGAHFDSWDLGQGALDNGMGLAQLFALAHALRGRELAHSVELIWFNGEEEGLWGSRQAAAQLGADPIIAMINLDMVGVPIAVNALGDDTLVPALQAWAQTRGSAALPRGVENINWFGSDHTPYQLAGVRALTFNGPIPRESVRFYHDFADTIDKLPAQIIVDSTAVIGDLVLTLANSATLTAARRSPAETEKLFTTFGLERRMQAVGYWPFPASP